MSNQIAAIDQVDLVVLAAMARCEPLQAEALHGAAIDCVQPQLVGCRSGARGVRRVGATGGGRLRLPRASGRETAADRQTHARTRLGLGLGHVLFSFLETMLKNHKNKNMKNVKEKMFLSTKTLSLTINLLVKTCFFCKLIKFVTVTWSVTVC